MSSAANQIDTHSYLAPNTMCRLEIYPDSDLDNLEVLAVSHFEILVHVESYTDGRVFSIGFLLRDRFGFSGTLIASGDILPDQVGALERCGYDRVESRHPMPPGLNRILHGYQPAHRVLPPAVDTPMNTMTIR